jgi:hypothetical protein
MDSAALVSIDIHRGAEMLSALDRAGLKVKVAVFAALSEYENWRLILAGPRFDDLRITDAYGLLHASLDAVGFDSATQPTTLILPMSDPFIKQLRRAYRKSQNAEGLRLGGQVFGDRFIRDAYVYRIT